MAQVKKQAVREAILQSAFALFADRGYATTTLADIAAGAGVAASSIYVYFASKLDILFAVYRPWLMDALARLEQELATIPEPRQRLRRILLALWHDIPAQDNVFSHNLMQAISAIAPGERYSRDLLFRAEGEITRLLRGCLPPERHSMLEQDRLSHLLFMAFDGFVINRRLAGPSRRVAAIADLTCDLLLGPKG